MEVDDGLRACQAPRETGVVALRQSKFGCQRVGFDGLAAALARDQRAEGPGVAPPAPVGQGRGIEALATQDGADPAGLSGAIGIGQDAQLVLDREGPAPGAVR